MYSYELSATPASLESAESSLLSLCRFLEVCASVYGSECVSACRSALHQTFEGGESTLCHGTCGWCRPATICERFGPLGSITFQ